MADKEVVINQKVEYTGIFSFSGLYSFVHSWLKDQEDFSVIENKYSEKVNGNAREISIEWGASKRMGDYFKVDIGVDFSVKDLTEVEVEIDGQKKRTNKGKVSIGLKGVLTKDYSSKWEDKPFNKFLREVYDKYVIPQRIDNMQGMVFGTVNKLNGEIKSYLELSGKK